jgi:2-polyprenyl-3-methyl-5-hydroxy-6-metoxy-1,4-benzoquinol methylase
MKASGYNLSQGNVVICSACNGCEHTVLRSVFDDRYGHPATFQLAQCRQCGHVMTLPSLREEDLPELYGTYYPRKALTAELVARQATQAQTRMSRLSRWWMGGDNQGQLDVKRGEKMLDIGCGSGFSLLVAKSMGADAYGVEADPNVQVLAKELNLAIHQGSIHDHPFPGVSFDVVVLNQVIEHIPEPGLALQVIADRLAPGGRIILVFPNRSSFYSRIFGMRWINWHIPYHLHHFTLSGFRSMAERYGLQMVRHRTITPNLWTFLQLRAALKKPMQGQPSPVWAVAAAASGGTSVGGNELQRKTLKMAILPVLLGLFGVVNRCVDLLGQGDCLMVELRREQGQ